MLAKRHLQRNHYLESAYAFMHTLIYSEKGILLDIVYIFKVCLCLIECSIISCDLCHTALVSVGGNLL